MENLGPDVGAAVASSHPEGAYGTMSRDAGRAMGMGGDEEEEEKQRQQTGGKGDSSDQKQLLSGDGGSSSSSSGDDAGSMKAVATSIWQSLLSIFASIFVIVCITSFFTVVPSDNIQLPVILFYVKNGADFAGRCASLLPFSINNQWHLLWAVAARCLLFPVFFIYTLTPAFGRSDILIIMIVAISSVTSGWVNTQCYMVASASVKAEHKPTAAGLMNLVFQTSILASLGASIGLLQV